MTSDPYPSIREILFRLLHSRKVVLALVAWLTGAVGLALGAVTAEMFLTLTEAMFAAVILGIAIEDHGEKSGGIVNQYTLNQEVDPAEGDGILRRPDEPGAAL